MIYYVIRLPLDVCVLYRYGRISATILWAVTIGVYVSGTAKII